MGESWAFELTRGGRGSVRVVIAINCFGICKASLIAPGSAMSLSSVGEALIQRLMFSLKFGRDNSPQLFASYMKRQRDSFSFLLILETPRLLSDY